MLSKPLSKSVSEAQAIIACQDGGSRQWQPGMLKLFRSREHKTSRGAREMSKNRTARVAIISGAIAGLLATVGPVAFAAAGELVNTNSSTANVTVVEEAPMLAIG